MYPSSFECKRTDMKIIVIIACLWVTLVCGQQFPIRDPNVITYCTVNKEEQQKCEIISEHLQRNPQYDRVGRPISTLRLNCTQSFNKDECMLLIDNEMADVTSLDAGEVFVGGRYNSLVPILQEMYEGDAYGQTGRIYAVAVVRKTSPVRSLRDLRGVRACFGGVGSLAGWIVPVSKLMSKGGMDVVDCNNHVKTVTEYFGPSCAVNSLSNKYNPLGDNSDKLCAICGSSTPGVKCTSNDPYAGYQGAINCLMDQGEIAFVKHSSVREYFDTMGKLAEYQAELARNNSEERDGRRPFFSSQQGNDGSRNFGTQQFNPSSQSSSFSPFGSNGQSSRGSGRQFGGDRPFNFGQQQNEDESNVRLSSEPVLSAATSASYNRFLETFELLCEDGSRRSLENWKDCYWEDIPSHAIVTSSGKPVETHRKYQAFFQTLARSFGKRRAQESSGNQISAPYELNVFESVPRHGNRSNLLFQDATVSFKSLTEEDQLYTKYLGGNMESIMAVRSCPVGRMTLCITSEAEYNKCIKMRTALNAQLLKPEMVCYKAHSQINCMEAIRSGDADAAVMDAGDIYTAGYIYDLIPVLSEIYNLQEPEYYAVAVAYQGDADTELTYLKGKNSCHSGVGHAAGWVIPMAYLISSGRMRRYGCDSLMAASQYFTKSCVPGALSNEFNFGGQYNNLCDLCRGSSSAYCSRQAGEEFYGNTGAFRCLIEGGGHVAFVKHTTVMEVTDGKRRETWARNTLSGDYELLCRDGTRAPVTDYARCNIGKVKANAVVIRGGAQYNETTAQAFINLFLYAQQFYGGKFDDDFKFAMFYSKPPYSDLIFQDAAQQIRVIPKEQQNYRAYLGRNFLRARALVDCRAGSSSVESHFRVLSFFTLLFVPIYIRLF